MEPIIMFFGGLATKDSYFSTQKHIHQWNLRDI